MVSTTVIITFTVPGNIDPDDLAGEIVGAWCDMTRNDYAEAHGRDVWENGEVSASVIVGHSDD